MIKSKGKDLFEGFGGFMIRVRVRKVKDVF